MAKTKTRLLTVGLAVIVLIAALLVIHSVGKTAGAEGVWDGASKTEFAGSGTENDPYEISNGAEFAYFVDQVNSGNTYGNKYIRLSDDIDLGGNELSPIGSESVPFKGNFDGNGKAIKNLAISSDQDFIALFRYNSGTISSLYLDNVQIYSPNCLGGIAAYNYGTIDGCGVRSGELKAGTNGGNIGGIVSDNSGTVSRCFNNASILCGGDVAGIAATNEQGGIIENCYNTGSITATYNSANGICATNYGTIKNCLNAGEITNTGTGSNLTENGICYSAGVYSTFENCYNVSEVFSGDVLNGIAYSSSASVKNVWSMGITEICNGKLPDGFDSSVWSAGSVGGISDEKDRFAVREYNYPSLTGVGTASAKVPVYNFSTSDAEDWETYTRIETAEQFQAIGRDSYSWSNNYVLGNDIDLSGVKLTPIGDLGRWF